MGTLKFSTFHFFVFSQVLTVCLYNLYDLIVGRKEGLILQIGRLLRYNEYKFVRLESYRAAI